jgi:hypothetical protein
MATYSNGISALATATPARARLAEVSWLICANLRQSLMVPSRNPLARLVEVDETEVACRSKHVPAPWWWTLSPGQDHRRRCRRGQGWRVPAASVAEVPNYSAGSLHSFRTKLAGGPQSRSGCVARQRNLPDG